jgi:hypothetical protein
LVGPRDVIIQNGRQELAAIALLKLVDLLIHGRVVRRLAFSVTEGYFVFWTTRKGSKGW